MLSREMVKNCVYPALAVDRSKVVILLLLIHFLLVPPIMCGGFMLDPCLVIQLLVSFLVLQSSC